MPPHRYEVFAPQAILQMDDGIYAERYPNDPYYPPWPQRCFGQSSPDISSYSVMGNVLWSVNSSAPPWGPWYTTCDSLAPFQPASMTSSAPYFETTWDVPGTQDAVGTHYGFGGYDFTWFYVLVEDYWQDADQNGEHDSLIANYIYVDGNVAEATITTDTSNPDTATGKYDWTEYNPYGDYGFITVISGSSAGEDDFADDTGTVTVTVDDTDPYNPWTLPQGVPGDTIAIPLDVEYHWPEAHETAEDGAMTTSHKTVYAQKGIVVRVQVPEEIWAGESRPIYATLNGKYNDGASRCGDVPWTYPIRWEVALPELVEEGGEIVDITAPSGDDFTPAMDAVAAHRIKQPTSPLYLGDISAFNGCVVYVRAVLSGVRVSGGQVVSSGGTVHDIKSVWARVTLCQEIWAVDRAGEEIDYTATYPSDSGEGRGDMITEDPVDALYAFACQFEGDLDPDSPDEVTAWVQGAEYELTESATSSPYDPANDTKYFRAVAGDVVVSLTLNDYSGFDDEQIDTLESELHYEDGVDIDVTSTRILKESSFDSLAFAENSVSAWIKFNDQPSPDVIDTVEVFIANETVPHARWVALEETGPASLIFRSIHESDEQAQVRLTESPCFSEYERDEITLLVSVRDHTSLDDSTVMVRETAEDSLVFGVPIVTGQSDASYPDLQDANFFKPHVKRFPAVAGTSIRGRVITADDDLAFSYIFSPASMAHVGGWIMPVTCAGEVPPLEGVPEDTAKVRVDTDLCTKESFQEQAKLIAGEDDDLFSYMIIVETRRSVDDHGAPVDKRYYAAVRFIAYAVVDQWGKPMGSGKPVYYGIGFPHSAVGTTAYPIRDNYLYAVDSLLRFVNDPIPTEDVAIPEFLELSVYVNWGVTYESFLADLERLAGEKPWPDDGESKLSGMDVIVLNTHGTYEEGQYHYLSFMRQAEQSGDPARPQGVRYTFDSSELSGVFGYFAVPPRGKPKLQGPVFVYLAACSTTYDRWTATREPAHCKHHPPAEWWRRTFNARALVGWNAITFSYLHDHFGRALFTDKEEELKTTVHKVNEIMKSAKTFGTEDQYYEVRRNYEKFLKLHYEDHELWAEMRYSIVDVPGQGSGFNLYKALRSNVRKWPVNLTGKGVGYEAE